MTVRTVSKQTLSRLPLYLNFLKQLSQSEPENISAAAIAERLHLNPVQVRKDLSAVSTSGRPKIGYIVRDLIVEIERFLGYNNVNDAVIVGAGKLGKALLGYEGFREYGLNILAAFDADKRLSSSEDADKPIFSMDMLNVVCGRLNVQIGIITVPSTQAQQVCDRLIGAGVKAIWNFAPIALVVPEGILVQNENMASSLAILSNHLAEALARNEKERLLDG